MTFEAGFVPIAVPALASAAQAADIASFNAQFVSNIVTSANSVLSSAVALKDTNFYSVGDIPVLGPQLLFIDLDLMNALKERPAATQPATDWSTLEHNLDQLAALIPPTAPTLPSVSADVATLTAVAPTITLPTAPDADVGSGPGSGPNVFDAPIPDAPSIVLPSVPTFEELQLPASPSIQLPEWTVIAPQNLVSPPSGQFSYVDPGYVSDLHDPLVLKLLGDLQNGSYGIDAGDETALWFRARDRASQQATLEVTEAMRRMASTSFPMPQGSMLDAIEQAEQKSQKVLSEANREIALRRSELYVEGRKFTIQQVQSYEKVRIDLYNATQERALNYSKAVVEMGIAIYDASVKNYMAQIEGYKAEAQVFETRIRGELAKADIFRTQIEAEKLRIDFNRAKLELFNGQLAAVNATVELYRTRLQAAGLYTQIQAQRIEIYRSQVMAYAERVRAKEAEFSIYQAQIKGQLAQLDVYKAQIDAYNATISGASARATVQLQSNESLLQAFRSASLSYANQAEQINKQITGRLDEAKTKGVYYGLDVDAYRAFTTASAEGARVQADLNKYNLDWNKANLASRVAQVGFRLQQLGLSVDLQKDVNKSGADFLKTAIGSAASGLNSLGVASTSA